MKKLVYKIIIIVLGLALVIVTYAVIAYLLYLPPEAVETNFQTESYEYGPPPDTQSLIDKEELDRAEKRKIIKADLERAALDPKLSKLVAVFNESGCDSIYQIGSISNPNGLTFTQMISEQKPVTENEDGTKVYLVPCSLGAYNTGELVVLYDSQVYTPLETISYDQDGEEYSSFGLSNTYYDPQSGIFSSSHKSRGLGDCWVVAEYKLIGHELVLQEYRAKWECDGSYDTAQEIIYYP